MKKSELIFVITTVLVGLLIPFPGSAQLAIAPLAIAAAIAAVPELVKMGAGLGQKVKSNRLIKNNKRPTLNYPVPQEYYDNMMAAKNMAGVSGLPGQGQIENRMDAQGANAISLASQTQQSPAAIMAGVSSMSNNLMGAEADLGVKGAEFKAKNLAQYFGANEQLAGAELNKFNNEWDWNYAQPYLSAMSAASALREGGAQNAFSGLEGLSSLATSFFADKLKNAAPASEGGDASKTNVGVGLSTENADLPGYDITQQNAWYDPLTGVKRYGKMPFDFQNDLWKSKEGQPWE
jgi:hypothetical protein